MEKPLAGLSFVFGSTFMPLHKISICTFKTATLKKTLLFGGIVKGASVPLLEEIDQLDLRDVRDQETAKRALEVAAAGGHNRL